MNDNLRLACGCRSYCGCARLSVWSWLLSTVLGIVGGMVIAVLVAWALLAVVLPW